MFVRLALETDFDVITEMARLNIEETRSDMVWDENRCRQTLYDYLDKAAPTIFVVEDRREVIGFLLADIYDYRAAEGLFVSQEVLFVHPVRRGSRAATLLMKHLIDWAKSLGAKELIGGNDNNFKSERTAKFLEHFGFERIGFAMRKVI